MNTAFSILHEIARSPSHNEEQISFAGMVRAFAAAVSGVDRANIHYVPAYSKSHLIKKLQVFYDQISIYKYLTDRLMNDILDDKEFVTITEAAATIYAGTDVEYARVDSNSAIDDISKAQSVYNDIEMNYNVSIIELDYVGKVFEQSVKDYQEEMERKSILKFIKGAFSACVGFFTGNFIKAFSGIGKIL